MKSMMFPGSIAAACAGAALYYYTTLSPLAHVVAEVDQSVSVTQNCAGLREAVEALAANRPGIREGSTLSLLVMGADVSAPDPARKWTVEFPKPSKRIYGGDKEAYEQQMQALFDQIEQGCRAPEPSLHSPVYRLVKLGISHLRSLGCAREGRCYLLIKSDLDEHVNAELEAAIARAAGEGAADLPAGLAGSIDNAGIAVTFCGTAETQAVPKGKQPPAPPEIRARVWEGLFTHPELVSFSPYCGKAAGLALASATH